MDSAVLSIIIIGITCVLFFVERIPLAVTCLMSALAMGIFGVMPIEEIYNGFSSSVFIMVMGMLIIGDCIFETGLAKVLGQKLMKTNIAKNERVLLAVLMSVAGVASGFLSNSAVVATFIPLAGAMVASSNGRLKNKNLVMGIGMAAALGGCATIVGSASQLAAQSILQATDGVRTMTFFELGYVVWPMLILLIIYMCTIGYNLTRKYIHVDEGVNNIASSTSDIHVDEDVNNIASTSDIHVDEDVNSIASTSDESEEDTKITFHMAVSGLVLLGCIIGFIAEIWNVAVVALLGATICIVTGCKPFKRAFAELDWNTLVILAAAQGFAQGLSYSGGGLLISEFFVNILGQNTPPVIYMVVGIFISTALTNIMSNTALTAMLTPIFINIGFALGIDPIGLVIGVVVGASTALATPIGTPALTQTLVAGYKFKHYIIVGLPITIVLAIVASIISPIAYPLTQLV